MKKIGSIVVLLLLLVPSLASAVILAPTAVINIIVGADVNNADYVDRSFDFVLKDLNTDPSTEQSYTVTTEDHYQNYEVEVPLGAYELKQITPEGFDLSSISCVSGYGSSAFYNVDYATNIAHINFVQPARVLCYYGYQSQVVQHKTPVLIVPGLFGTEITKGGDVLWADIERMVNPVHSDSFLDPLQFNSDLTPLDNSIQVGRVIREATSAPSTLFSFDYTKSLIDLLVSEGYTEGVDLFTFPYDWRYGASEEAVSQLKGQIDYILNQTEAGQAAGKVNVVAHSTGGLIVKKYVMEHLADHHIDKAVFVGVPNLGAPKAFKALINGDGFGIPGLDDDEMKKIAQNLPVSYDLAPSPQYIDVAGNFLSVLNPYVSLLDKGKNLNYSESISEFNKDNLINQQGLAGGQALHTVDFDNFDMRTAGVDLSAIIGCKSPTFGSFTKKYITPNSAVYDFPKVTSGDRTVPFVSADSLKVDADKTYFLPKADHGKMLSADGVRQQITNILTGSGLDTNGKIRPYSEVQQYPSECQIKGESIQIHSPIDIMVMDESGNVSGLADDGSIQNDIPGADYEIWGDHKYVFLPTDEGQTYNVKLKGTDTGTYTIDDETVDGDAVVKTQVFSNLPVTSDLTGSINLGESATLTIQQNSTSSPETILPSSTLTPDQSADILPPVSTSTLSGLMGQPGFFRSTVNVALSAEDAVVPGKEGETSGVLNTRYSVDGSPYAVYSSSTPIQITTQGAHTVKFYSTDRAGNNETEQSVSFTIDTTAPEFSMQFSSAAKDLAFTPTDNFSTTSAVAVLDQDNSVTFTDEAGNVTKLTLKDKDRKKKLKSEIQSLSYNGVAADISKTVLKFNWNYDKQGQLKTLEQHVKSKQDFNIDAEFTNGKTKLTGKDKTGKINQTLPGPITLQVTTNQGDFSWSY